MMVAEPLNAETDAGTDASQHLLDLDEIETDVEDEKDTVDDDYIWIDGHRWFKCWSCGYIWDGNAQCSCYTTIDDMPYEEPDGEDMYDSSVSEDESTFPALSRSHSFF